MPRIRSDHVLVFLIAVLAIAPVPKAHAQVDAAAAAAQAQEDAQAQQRAALEQAMRAQAQQQEDQANFGGGGARAGRGGARASTRGRSGRGGSLGSMSDEQLRQLMASGSISPELYGQLMADRAQSTAASLTSTSASDSGEPKDLIALNLWVLTIDLPRAKAADDITAGLVARANDLPTVIGSRDDVRILVGKLTVAGALARSREFRTTALNGQIVSIQTGGNQPQVTASQMINGGRGGGRGGQVGGGGQVFGGGRINQIQYQPVGTNITFTPRVVAGGNVEVQLSYNSSDQEPDHTVAITEDDDGNRVPATRTVTQQIQATSRVKGGSAVLVQSDVLAEPTNEASSIRTQLIILGASIIPALDQ